MPFLPATFLVVSFQPQGFFCFHLPFFDLFWFGKIMFGRPNIPQRYLVYVTWTRTGMKFDIEVVLRIVVANDGSVQIFPEHPPRVARHFSVEDSTRERDGSPETLAYIQPLEIVLVQPN